MRARALSLSLTHTSYIIQSNRVSFCSPPPPPMMMMIRNHNNINPNNINNTNNDDDDDAEPELLCDFLLEAGGAVSATLTDADRGTAAEEPVFSEPVPSSSSSFGYSAIHASASAIRNGPQPAAAAAGDYDDSSRDQLQWTAPVWNRCNVTALFPASTDIDATIQLVREIFPALLLSQEDQQEQQEHEQYVVTQVPNQDWVVTVQRGWKPIVVANKFVLRFPWHTDEDVATAVFVERAISTNTSDCPSSSSSSNFATAADLVQLQLQGGIAFGTGEHPTTQLCLEWLHDIVAAELLSSERDPSPRTMTVLDYGSGSGVLGMAACALAKAATAATSAATAAALDDKDDGRIQQQQQQLLRVTATGIDIDVDACLIANANAAVNDVPMRSYLPPLVDTTDAESKSLLLKAHHQYATSTTTMNSNNAEASKNALLNERDGLVSSSSSSSDNNNNNNSLILEREHLEPFDVCVANILAAPLMSLAPTLYDMIKPGACIGMSGILPHQGDAVVRAYQAVGFESVAVVREMGGWILVTAKRPPAGCD